MTEWMLFFVVLAQLVIIAYLIHDRLKLEQRHSADFFLLADDAMAYMKSHNLGEKRLTDAQKTEYDIKLQYLKDSMERDAKAKNEVEQTPKKVEVTDERGATVTMNFDELEPLG